MNLRTLLKNIFANWMGYAVTILIGLFLSPLVVNRLGNTGYGVWTLVISLTGYFGLLDLGIRQSVGRYVARYVGLRDPDNVNRTISTSMAMLAIAGTAVMLITIVLSSIFTNFFKVEPEFVSPARIVLLIGGLQVAIALPMGVFNTPLWATERFEVVTAISVGSSILRSGLVVVALRSGYGVVALAWIALACSCMEYAITVITAKRLLPTLSVGRAWVDWQRGRELLGFGVFRFIWIISNQLVFYSSELVIGFFLGAGSITPYAIAVSILSYMRNIISLSTDTFAPAATRLDGHDDAQGLRELLIMGTQMTLIVALPMCFGLLFLGHQFIVLWMGPEHAYSAVLLAVLVVPQFVSLAQYMSTRILICMGRHHMLAYIGIAEGVTNLILGAILVQRMGLIGVAVGAAIPHIITSAVLIPWYTLRTLNMSWREYITSYIRPLLASAPAAGLSYFFSVTVTQLSWRVFLGEVLVVCASAAVTGWFVCVTPKQRVAVLLKIRQKLNLRPANEKSTIEV